MAINQSVITDNYAFYHGDCVEFTESMPDKSVGLCVYSPPFAELYNYSSSPRDMSNCVNYEQFLEHYEYLVQHLARVTIPGRLNAIHCMEVPMGTLANRDMPGDIIRLYQKYGFQFLRKVMVWKEPLRVAIRTRVLNLRHSQIVKDSTKCYPAGPDYVVLMRKPGADEPVGNPLGLTYYAGELDADKRGQVGLKPAPLHLQSKFANWDDPRTNKWAHWIWQQYASPVWMDIRMGRLLSRKIAKESPEEKHICPLQLDVIERIVQMYSNPGDTVYSPFGGIGSEPRSAVALGRKGVGVELKESYYRQAIRNLAAAAAAEELEEQDLFTGSEFAIEGDDPFETDGEDFSEEVSE